jgi:hypothetical protein
MTVDKLEATQAEKTAVEAKLLQLESDLKAAAEDRLEHEGFYDAFSLPQFNDHFWLMEKGLANWCTLHCIPTPWHILPCRLSFGASYLAWVAKMVHSFSDFRQLGHFLESIHFSGDLLFWRRK